MFVSSMYFYTNLCLSGFRRHKRIEIPDVVNQIFKKKQQYFLLGYRHINANRKEETGKGLAQIPTRAIFIFNILYHVSLFILYSDQLMHNYFTHYHTPTCFDTIASSSGNL